MFALVRVLTLVRGEARRVPRLKRDREKLEAETEKKVVTG